MFGGTIFVDEEGNRPLTDAMLAEAIHCGHLVSFAKQAIGIDSLVREYDLIAGGTVRCIDSYYLQAIEITPPPIGAVGGEEQVEREESFCLRGFIYIPKDDVCSDGWGAPYDTGSVLGTCGGSNPENIISRGEESTVWNLTRATAFLSPYTEDTTPSYPSLWGSMYWGTRGYWYGENCNDVLTWNSSNLYHKGASLSETIKVYGAAIHAGTGRIIIATNKGLIEARPDPFSFNNYEYDAVSNPGGYKVIVARDYDGGGDADLAPAFIRFNSDGSEAAGACRNCIVDIAISVDNDGELSATWATTFQNVDTRGVATTDYDLIQNSESPTVPGVYSQFRFFAGVYELEVNSASSYGFEYAIDFWYDGLTKIPVYYHKAYSFSATTHSLLDNTASGYYQDVHQTSSSTTTSREWLSWTTLDGTEQEFEIGNNDGSESAEEVSTITVTTHAWTYTVGNSTEYRDNTYTYLTFFDPTAPAYSGISRDYVINVSGTTSDSQPVTTPLTLPPVSGLRSQTDILFLDYKGNRVVEDEEVTNSTTAYAAGNFIDLDIVSSHTDHGTPDYDSFLPKQITDIVRLTGILSEETWGAYDGEALFWCGASLDGDVFYSFLDDVDDPVAFHSLPITDRPRFEDIGLF